MHAQVAESSTAERVAQPPVRIRTVLLILILAWCGYGVYPRAVAAWELHGLATAVADYALCMVGPTGPTLIRDNPGQFAVLVRRRLVAAPADEQPFAECAELARSITGSEGVSQAHGARALEYAEYRAQRSRPALHSLADIRVTSEPLAEMSRQAWPFVRGGYARLVKASLSADEAVHPIAPPAPALGSGLPNWYARYRAVRKTKTGFIVAMGQGANLSVYESNDAGISWNPISARDQPSESAERCLVDSDGRSFIFSSSDDGRSTLLSSLGPGGAPYATLLAPAEQEVVTAACDSDGMVVVLRAGKKRAPKFLLCPFRRSCSPMRPPISGEALSQFTDVARIHGTTVMAFSDGGVVRVSSSRDDGRSWTPLSVAHDAHENQQAAMGLPAPGRLLTLDDRLLLYGGAERSQQAYLTLVSDDHGASWRTP